MSRLTFHYIIEEATQTYDSWSNADRVNFHYFNPNGEYAKWKGMCDTIRHYVNANVVPSGWHLAYGSFADFHANELEKLFKAVSDGKRVGKIDLDVTLLQLREATNKGYEKLAERIMEG